ncbi:MAG TPA: choice-of-anchor Q domain-containing protein [Anaerolineaceae bacterium]|nr:choice-of-anchor Q domain-containing protein [Anaerolineaceae bacterium]
MKNPFFSRIATVMFLLAFICTLIGPLQTVHAAAIYRIIPSGATSGSCGDTWGNGCDLQYALISKASSGDELWVKMGSYKPASDGNRRTSFVLKNGVSMYGGFNGTESQREQRNWVTNPTTLTGDLNGDDGSNFTNYSDNSLHVVTGNSISTTTVVDGFIIRGGNATINFSSQPDRIGGGMSVLYNCPSLSNIIFTANSVQDDGGGLYAYNCSATYTNLTFTENRAGRDGGGMYNDYLGMITLHSALFFDNTAVHAGGGMYETDSAAVLNGVSFESNQADFGGGMIIDTDLSSPMPSLSNVYFQNNIADERGGGLYVYSSYVNITDVRFNGNSAATSGGGMGNYDSHPSLTNATFSGNSAPVNSGGAIYNFSNSTSAIRNSVLWNDIGNEIVNSDTSTATITYSLVQGCNPGGAWQNSCGVNLGYNLPDTDPSFDTGLRLNSDSVAIDNGNNAFLNGLTTDLDGNPRVVGGVVDLGAYEYQHGPSIYRVVPVGGKTSGACGDSWANACDLQYALATKSVYDDELWVKAGTYTPTTTASRAISFALKSGVRVLGGFAGTETDSGQRNWNTHVTILSGDLSGNDQPGFINYSDNSYHVVIANGVDYSTTLDGFTIRGGSADGSYPNNYGGGLFLLSGNLSLNNLKVVENWASNIGGGLDINDQARLNNVAITGNLAAYGGGIANSGTPVLQRVIISSNTAQADGGGFYNFNDGIPGIYNCLFYNNTATNRGGGLFNAPGNPVLINVTFWGNAASTAGGIYNTNGSSPFIQNTILWGDPGGEIVNDSSGDPNVPLISNSLISGCNPGGVWNTTCGHNDGNNLPDANPQFFNTALADFRLAVGSPAINAGDDALYNDGYFVLDLAGNPRKFGMHVDIGAYEMPYFSIFLPAIRR